MKKRLPGITDIDKKKTDATPLELHQKAKINKAGSAEF